MVKVFLQEPADAVFGSRFLAGDYRRVLFFRHEYKPSKSGTRPAASSLFYNADFYSNAAGMRELSLSFPPVRPLYFLSFPKVSRFYYCRQRRNIGWLLPKYILFVRSCNWLFVREIYSICLFIFTDIISLTRLFCFAKCA